MVYHFIIHYVMAMNNRNKPQTKSLGEIPKKIFYSISEASGYTGVEPHVLRYWETKFSKLNPKRVGGNQRKYTRSDLELLYEIVNLLYNEGYTLDGAERKLRKGVQNLKQERKAKKKETLAKEEEHPRQELPPAPIEEANPPKEVDLKSIKDELQSILRLLK